jgi:hypothetical protein
MLHRRPARPQCASPPSPRTPGERHRSHGIVPAAPGRTPIDRGSFPRCRACKTTGPDSSSPQRVTKFCQGSLATENFDRASVRFRVPPQPTLFASRCSSIAGRIRIIPARSTVIIAAIVIRGRHCCTNGGCTHGGCTHTSTHIGSTICAATIDTTVIAAHANTASAIASSIRHSLGGNTCDAKDARCGNASDSSI